MRRLPSAKAASVEVTLIKLAVEKVLGSLFHDQPTEDYGVNAQREIVEGQAVDGKLLALQVKRAEPVGKPVTPAAGLDRVGRHCHGLALGLCVVARG
jgi:hypothetical protein